jgi:hypothetical protein
MLIIIKHFILSLSTALNLSNSSNKVTFFNIFNIRFFYSFINIRNFLNPAKIDASNFIISNNFFQNKIRSSKIVYDLDNFGFNNILKLKNTILKLLKNEITLDNSKIEFKGEKKTKKFIQSLKKKDNIDIILTKSKKIISHVVLNINISRTNYIKKLATSDFFLDIAKKYINTNNISIAAQCFISNPVKISELEKKNNAQYFHYDNDFKKFFKVFIYLNKVDKYSGPHSFVKSTNKKRKLKHIIAERINDSEIRKDYGSKNVKVFNGNAGSVIIEDTFGLHKGSFPQKKSRLVLILVYGSGLGIEIYKNPLIKKL